MDRPLREPKTQTREVLARVRLFADWPPELLDRVAAAAILRKVSAGEAIFLMGGEFPYLVILAKGVLSAQRTMRNGKVIVFDFLLPGQSTSHITVLDGQPNSLDIVARSESDIILIPRETILGAIRRDPDRLFDVIQFLCRRTRLDYELIHLRMANSLRCQLAKILLYWGRGSQLPSGFEVPALLSQDDLAAMFGNSRQSVNRELGKMVKQGMLAIRYKRLYVVDVARMAQIVANEDPSPEALDKALYNRPKNTFAAAD